MATDVYIIDTSCLIQAHRQYYPFDIAPSFWDFLEQEFKKGNFILINKVQEEILRGKDKVSDFVQLRLPASCLLDCHSDQQIMNNYGEIMAWGNSNPRYNPQAKRDFAEFEHADPFLVATAMTISGTVVSQEVSDPLTKRIIKLPDVCTQFNVPHCDTFTLLRRFGFRM